MAKVGTRASLAALIAAVLLVACCGVEADVYMHNPRGSNNRACENGNRNNANRLFDSQNNGAGGYDCPRAFPFACYTLEGAARDTCNQINSVAGNDDISEAGIADDDGVLDPRGVRTPKLYYYEGSILQIEWTNQHGCGENSRTHCDIIIQYACEDTLTDDCGEPNSGKTCGPRDGIPITNSETDRGTAAYVSITGGDPVSISRRTRDRYGGATIPISISHNVQSDPRFGRHEPLSYYLKCLRRERNKGLWIADRTIGDAATRTRQNNGNRYGFECAEEAQYYPYWAPSPWKDIAILTTRTDDCAKMVAESQNIKEKYECVCPSCTGLIPNNKNACSMNGGSWIAVPPHDIRAPVCGPPPTTRENQLGNPIGGGKSASSFNWTIPRNIPAGKSCVLRLRYNISTGDPLPDSDDLLTVHATAGLNGANSPIVDRKKVGAYKSFVEMPKETHPAARLGLSYNSNQLGRTFQDRSHTFEIRKPPQSGECAGKKIYNLNVRGRRGNIVEAYPSVEYDFAPSEMYVTDLDCVHVQWTGTDYGQNQNPSSAFGGPPNPNNVNEARSDRHNLVQIHAGGENHPVASLDHDFNMFSTSRERKIHLAFIGQPIEDTTVCATVEALFAEVTDDDARDRHWKNCGKLNGAKTPYFDGGLFKPGPVGTYYYMSTRGNSFSNRNQVGILHVRSGILANGTIVFVVLGGAVALAFAAAGFLAYRRRSRSAVVEGAPGSGVVAMFGHGGKTAISHQQDPAVPVVPRRAKPGMTLAPAKTETSTTVTAMYSHQATEAGELEFRKGDVITVLRRDDSGWWEGRTPDGKKGIFPANYVTAN